MCYFVKYPLVQMFSLGVKHSVVCCYILNCGYLTHAFFALYDVHVLPRWAASHILPRRVVLTTSQDICARLIEKCVLIVESINLIRLFLISVKFNTICRKDCKSIVCCSHFHAFILSTHFIKRFVLRIHRAKSNKDLPRTFAFENEHGANIWKKFAFVGTIWLDGFWHQNMLLKKCLHTFNLFGLLQHCNQGRP